MSGITCKFGGTSLADADAILTAQRIIDAHPDRRFIVPSAPGKRHPKDRKVTDLLYAWHGLAQQGLDAAEPKGIIRQRFNELAEALKVDVDFQSLLNQIEADVSAGDPEENPLLKTADYMASRGEYLNGHLMAALLDAELVEPEKYIKFDNKGMLDPVTFELLGEKLKGGGRYIVPGFFGSTPDGRIKTFSRGGSDITGSIVARASQSILYENWTDVSGFRMADPRVVPEARRIEEITYKELRELSYMGATVLHDEAIYPVREPRIPIQIRNTKEPDNPGTLIVADRESTEPVCGIAGTSGFSMIVIEKALMNKEFAFGSKVLNVLEEHGVSWEHMPTGIDTISLIVRDEELAEKGPALVEDIERRVKADNVHVVSGLAMIATVGKGMNHHIGVAAKLFTAIAEAGVNLRVIDQGSTEMNIIIGVEEPDLPKAIAAIYRAFTSD